MKTQAPSTYPLSSYFENLSDRISTPFSADIKNEIIKKLDSTGESYTFRDHSFFIEAKTKNATYLVAGTINSQQFSFLENLAKSKEENIVYFVRNVITNTP